MSQSTHSRKRKTSVPDPDDTRLPVAKKTKTSKHEKRKAAKTVENARDGEFHVVASTLTVSIPPLYASNPKQGVQEMLDGMLMRYIPALKGVVISHTNLQFLDQTTTIKADCPFAICRVAFDATVWSPRVGMKILGKVNLCSPDHISVLVHKVFNASIPRHHIPTDHWEFEYGPAENDPEFAPDAPPLADPSPADEDIEMVETTDPPKVPEPLKDQDDQTSNDGGQWVHKLSSEKIGGSNGYLEFTVIGLTMANQMLSLVGSLQLDPFSPRHVLSTSPTRSQEEEEEAVLNELQVDLDKLSESDGEEEDAFAKLGKIADKTKEAEKRVKEQTEAETQKKPKKKKRKEVAEQEAGVGKQKKQKQKKV